MNAQFETTAESVTGSSPNIALVGAGVMGQALLSGFLQAGRDPKTIWISESRAERAAQLRSRYPVHVSDPEVALAACPIVILAVKPGDAIAVLHQVRAYFRPDAVLLSVAAGLTTEFLAAALPPGSAVLRVMPNTPVMVNQGMSVLSAGEHCRPEQVQAALELMQSVGRAVVLPEQQQDAATALSGSGPAFIFYVIEAMIEAGLNVGLPRIIATELAGQTVLGAASLLSHTGIHPTLLREQVGSPGGTTVVGIRKLDDHKVRSAVIDAIEAARNRSQELALGD